MNRFRRFITNYQFSLLAWLLIAILVIAGFHFGVDKKVIAFVVLLVGIIGQAFAALIAWIALIPIAGPILAQVLSMPFVWTLNGIGYLLSISAIKRGYSKDVIISSTLAYLAFTLSAEPRHHLVLSGGDRTPDTRIEEIYAPFDTLRTDLEDYRWPTNASTVITSSFADYRRTHFHEGIDISTNNQRGHPVYASRGGYVSRIHVSRRGYGKMLFLRHPDGFLTAYAHLQKFKDSIEVVVKELQKQNKNYALEVDLDSTAFPVDKGDVIGYSGDTGTGGAHLHFELRDSSMNPINPFLSRHFSSLLRDDERPFFQRIAFTAIDRSSRIHGKWRVWVVDARRSQTGEFFLNRRVHVKGSIGISVRVWDRSNALKHRTGPHRFEVFLDGAQIFTSAKKFIPATESRQIATYYDRPLVKKRLGQFEKLYIESGNRLPFYNRLPEGAGIIETHDLQPGPHELTIHAFDLSGNQSVLRVTLMIGK
ncbi:MAG: M23 family metallopeptidase [Ignavibacteria bacterium]|nr:M23 family metallopeptidase [Ignavibacteria bacterium]